MASNVTTATTRTDDGVTLAYKMLGEGPRDLLFLHGWGGSGTGTFWGPSGIAWCSTSTSQACG